MPLSNDITLNAVAYNVVPGTYRKRSRTPPQLRRGRVEVGPFGEGQLQAIGEEAEQGWNSVGVRPVFDGQGVEPFPNETLFAGGMLDTPTATARASVVIAGTPPAAFLGLGRRIYKSVSLTTAGWVDWAAVADLGAGFTISGLAYYLGDLLVLLSTGQDIRKFNTSTNAVIVWRLGEKGVVGCGYAGQLIYAPRAANNEEELRLSLTKWNGNAVTALRYLDAPIITMANYNGEVAIATRQSLYLLGGQPYPGEADDAAVTADTSKAPAWLGDPRPIMGHGQYAAADDFIFLCSYRGRLYTWLSGRVAEFDGSSEEWRRMGPEGVVCYGGCVADDWLVVAIDSREAGSHQLWGFNGDGWWLLGQRSSAQEAFIWPAAIGGAGNRDLVAFRNGVTDYDLYRTRWRSSSLNSYRSSGTYTSALLDAGDPSRDKRWVAMGADFAEPYDRQLNTSVDFIALVLEYSIDGGVNWVTADVKNAYTLSALRIHTMASAFAPAAVPVSRYLQVRVRYVDILDWAPVLVSVWVEFEVRDTSRVKRRWELTVDASDRTARRDSQADSQTGRQKITALWDAWETGAAVNFLDVDNDTDTVTYSVTVVDIAEEIPKPADSGRWGESRVSLKLEEV